MALVDDSTRWLNQESPSSFYQNNPKGHLCYGYSGSLVIFRGCAPLSGPGKQVKGSSDHCTYEHRAFLNWQSWEKNTYNMAIQ